MLWQNVRASSILDEVNVFDLIAFEVDVRVFGHHVGFEERANPSMEGARFVLQKLQMLVVLVVNVLSHFILKPLGKLLNERVNILEFVLLLHVY